jgi:hypothetical protein
MALSQTATAGVPLFGHVSCALVRFYVAKYSEAAAETWARGHGASEADIETARHCLHGSSVQTAGRNREDRAPQVLATATQQEPARHEPAERGPDRDALQVVSVQDQPADSPQDGQEQALLGLASQKDLASPKNIEDRSAGDASQETRDDLVAPGVKIGTSHPHGAGAMHRADRMGVTAWLKRQWDRLVGRHRSSIVLFASHRSRSYNRVRSPWHRLSWIVPGCEPV